MRHQPKYRLPKSRPKPSRKSYWILALLLVAAGVAWIWWPSKKTPEPVPKQKSIPNPVVLPPPRPVNQPTVKSEDSLPKQSAVTATNIPSVVIRSNAPLTAPALATRPAQTVFEAQLALARRGISPGSLDGVNGSQTRAALRAFQRQEKLPASGELDEATRSRLTLDGAPHVTFVVTTNDLLRLRPLSTTWLAKSQQDRLDYETILELIAEKAQSSPNLIRRLNPGTPWTNLVAGTTVKIPNVEKSSARTKAAFVRIHLASKTLEAFDANTNLLAHFPCSIAARVEKRPIGELHVTAIAPNPDYTFNPEVFPESAEARQIGRKLILPPGPNNPVGDAWISLDQPGYGIHGTPNPEQVGRTESHGCFRLANWNAEYLLNLVTIGMPIFVEP